MKQTNLLIKDLLEISGIEGIFVFLLGLACAKLKIIYIGGVAAAVSLVLLFYIHLLDKQRRSRYNRSAANPQKIRSEGSSDQKEVPTQD